MEHLIYVDTSVIGGCFDPEFEEWSQQLIDGFTEGKNKVVLSDLTFRELEDAPEPIPMVVNRIPEKHQKRVVLEEKAKKLASQYIKEDVVTENQLVDAQHIAIATVHKVDILVSWNFKHIVHFDKIRKFNAVNLKMGYTTLEIRSPQEVV